MNKKFKDFKCIPGKLKLTSIKSIKLKSIKKSPTMKLLFAITKDKSKS